jgi:hypothetical protein
VQILFAGVFQRLHPCSKKGTGRGAATPPFGLAEKGSFAPAEYEALATVFVKANTRQAQQPETAFRVKVTDRPKPELAASRSMVDPDEWQTVNVQYASHCRAGSGA